MNAFLSQTHGQHCIMPHIHQQLRRYRQWCTRMHVQRRQRVVAAAAAPPNGWLLQGAVSRGISTTCAAAADSSESGDCLPEDIRFDVDPWAVQFRLCGLPFTYDSAITYLSTRLAQYPEGGVCSEGDAQILTALLENFHPSASAKIGPGISHFTVGTTVHGTRCYHVHRLDGTQEDFSYVRCMKNCVFMNLQGAVDEEGRPTQPVINIAQQYPGFLSGVRQRVARARASQGRQEQSLPAAEPWRMGGLQQQQHSEQFIDSWQPTNSPLQQMAWDANRQPTASPVQQMAWGPAAPQPPLPPHSQPQQLRVSAQSKPPQWPTVLKAMRAAVTDQLRGFRSLRTAEQGGTPAAAGLPQSPLTCDLTGQPLTLNQATVGYVPPQDFKQLAVGWLRQQGATSPLHVPITHSKDGRAPPQMADASQLASWRIYHATYAQFVLVAKKPNTAP